jgi:hypothetical protein
MTTMSRVKGMFETLATVLLGVIPADKSQATFLRFVLEVSIQRDGVHEGEVVRNVVLAFRKISFLTCEVYGACSEYPVGDLSNARWRNLDSLGAYWQEVGEGYLGAILSQMEHEARVASYPGAELVKIVTHCSTKQRSADCLIGVPALDWNEDHRKAAA